MCHHVKTIRTIASSMCIQIGAVTIVVKTQVTATLVLTSYDLYDY